MNNLNNIIDTIDTQEISGAQKVGSVGVSLTDLGPITGYVTALRVSSQGKAYNGPDFKVMGSVADIPEPSSLLGLGIEAVGLIAIRRKQAQAA